MLTAEDRCLEGLTKMKCILCKGDLVICGKLDAPYWKCPVCGTLSGVRYWHSAEVGPSSKNDAANAQSQSSDKEKANEN